MSNLHRHHHKVPESYRTFEVKAAFKKNEKRILSEQVLKDKVKGAWAGQTLGCSYGGPTEFKFLGTIIQDYIPIPWNEHMVKKWYQTEPIKSRETLFSFTLLLIMIIPFCILLI